MVIRLTDKQKEQIKDKFKDYVNSNKTAKDIAVELGINNTTVNKFYSKIFGEEYRKIAKLKSHKHCTMLSDEEVLKFFEQYKNGMSMIKLAELAKVHQHALAVRMRKIIGQEYTKIASIRHSEKAGDFCRKVIDSDIRIAFEKYKSTLISTTALAKRIRFSRKHTYF